MDRLVEALLQKAELLREEIDQILKGEDVNGVVPTTGPATASPAVTDSRNGNG